MNLRRVVDWIVIQHMASLAKIVAQREFLSLTCAEMNWILCIFIFQVCTREGFLMKQTSSFQRWRRRYFKLKGRTLYYAKDTKVRVLFLRHRLGPLSLCLLLIVLLPSLSSRLMTRESGSGLAAAAGESKQTSRQILLLTAAGAWFLIRTQIPSDTNRPNNLKVKILLPCRLTSLPLLHRGQRSVPRTVALLSCCYRYVISEELS